MIQKDKKRNINQKFKQPMYADLVATEQYMLTTFADLANKDVIDVGTGDGRIGFTITDIMKVKPSMLYLTDYNEEILLTADNNIFPEEREYIRTKVEDVTNLSFKSESFDVVTALGDTFSLIRSSDYGGGQYQNDSASFEIALKESLRVLREGGTLVFSINPATGDWRYLDKKHVFLEENYNLIILESRIVYTGILRTDILNDKRIIFACKKLTKEKQ